MLNAGLVGIVVSTANIASFWSRYLPNIARTRTSRSTAVAEIGLDVPEGQSRAQAAVDGFLAKYPAGLARHNEIVCTST